MLSKGANLDIKDSDGETVLAYSESKPEILKLLVAGGLNPNSKDSNGTPILIKYINIGDTDLVRLLLSKGANVKYNPEEIYSRGQEFSSVVGAYSDFDVNLMMQNLLAHIEDNEKAGGKFAISAFTKPVDKQIGHLEGGGGKIKFKIYPKSEDILWAANTDVYSGSVWDASEKVNKDKKSELLGVSYTKYPSLRNVNAVQPNLAAIVDNLSHHHNELGISLNFSNFEIEVDEDVPYTTKKIIENINKILQQKRLEEVNSIINKLEKEC